VTVGFTDGAVGLLAGATGGAGGFGAGTRGVADWTDRTVESTAEVAVCTGPPPALPVAGATIFAEGSAAEALAHERAKSTPNAARTAPSQGRTERGTGGLFAAGRISAREPSPSKSPLRRFSGSVRTPSRM
jgi:hypothetical protein